MHRLNKMAAFVNCLSFFSLPACDVESATIKRQALISPSKLLGAEIHPIPACDPVELAKLGIFFPNSTNIQHIIRVIVPANYNPAKAYDSVTLVRDVSYGPGVPTNPSDMPTSAPDEDNDYVGLTNGMNPRDKNPFHIDLSPFHREADGWVKIKIILKRSGSGGYLLKDSNNVGDPYIAKGPENVIMCGDSVPKKTKDIPYRNESISFFLYRYREGSGHTSTGSYSFRLTPVGAPDTPIYIDPKIKNTG